MTDEPDPATAPTELAHDLMQLVNSAKWAVSYAQEELLKAGTTGSWYGTANRFYEARREQLHDDIDRLNVLLEETDQLLFSIGRMCIV